MKDEFVYDGGKPGSGGMSRLSVDGEAGRRRRLKHQPYIYSADEGVDVGTDDETAVTADYKQGADRFTGKILKVTIQAGDVKMTTRKSKRWPRPQTAAIAGSSRPEST